MAKSYVRTPSSKKGRRLPAPDELASELQRNRFFKALEEAVVFNVGDACKAAGLSQRAVNTLLQQDEAFRQRYEDVREVHREAFKRVVGERGIGDSKRSGDPAMLKLYGQILFPEVMAEAKPSVQVNITLNDIKSMTTEQLIELRAKYAKRG